MKRTPLSLQLEVGLFLIRQISHDHLRGYTARIHDATGDLSPEVETQKMEESIFLEE